MIESHRLDDGLEHVTIDNGRVRAAFLPEIGGKMIELTHRASGTQFLLAPNGRGPGYRRPSYGASFTDYAQGGFDECLPTVEPAEYRPAGAGSGDRVVRFPDHGELWSRPWRWKLDGNELRLGIDGVRAAYSLEKSVRLHDNRITLSYTLRNCASEPLSYLWSAHPLLRVTEGSRLLLPEDVDRVLLNWTSDRELGRFGDELPWPSVPRNGERVDFSEVPNDRARLALKCFTPRLDSGRAGLYRADADASILFDFDPARTPYLGLWLCYGVTLAPAGEEQFTVGLEPANGRPDSLTRAVARQECPVLPAGGEHRWRLDLSLWNGTPDL